MQGLNAKAEAFIDENQNFYEIPADINSNQSPFTGSKQDYDPVLKVE